MALRALLILSVAALLAPLASVATGAVVLEVPQDMTVEATGPIGAKVTYSVSARAGDGRVLPGLEQRTLLGCARPERRRARRPRARRRLKTRRRRRRSRLVPERIRAGIRAGRWARWRWFLDPS